MPYLIKAKMKTILRKLFIDNLTAKNQLLKLQLES